MVKIVEKLDCIHISLLLLDCAAMQWYGFALVKLSVGLLSVTLNDFVIGYVLGNVK